MKILKISFFLFCFFIPFYFLLNLFFSISSSPSIEDLSIPQSCRCPKNILVSQAFPRETYEKKMELFL